MDQIYLQPDSLCTGLQTSVELDQPVPGLRVTWIEWDSGFRQSGLRIGDRIVAVADQPHVRYVDTPDARLRLSQSIGQYAESQGFAGGQDGDELRLRVQRRRIGGRGWQELEVRGQIRLIRSYRDEQNRPILGPGGPIGMEYDGFFESWNSFHEGLRRKLMGMVDLESRINPLTSAWALEELQKDEPRLAVLQERFAGPYADAMAADFVMVREELLGRPYQLTEEVLRWRRLSEERVIEVAEAGRAARGEFLKAHEQELIPPFPGIDPILGDRRAIAGKLVDLPAVSNREWIAQGARSCFVVSDGSTYYMVDAGGAAMQRALVASHRYVRQVGGVADGQYQIIGRILPEPGQVVLYERSYFALKVEPVAVMFGQEAVFVEVGEGRGPEPSYAGEESGGEGVAQVPEDAEPEVVLRTFFEALKYGQQKLWSTLFASFELSFSSTGRPIIDPSWETPQSLERTYGHARGVLLKKVYDVVVRWVDEPHTVVSGEEFPGAPRIDETVVVVEHVGRDPQGAYRRFSEAGLRVRWTLRRMNGGPFRIADRFGI